MPYPTYFPPSQGQQPIMQQPTQPANFSQRPAMPQPMMRPMYGTPSTLIRVNGRAGAEAYYMDAPNSEAALFDANDDVFYFKSTDGGGYPTIRAFRFEPLPEAGMAPVAYATKEEMDGLRREIDELKGVLTGGKQSRKTKPDTEE